MSDRDGEILEKLDRMGAQIDRIESRLFFGQPGAPSVVEELARLKNSNGSRDSSVVVKQVGAIVLAIITTAGTMWGVGKATGGQGATAVESATPAP